MLPKYRRSTCAPLTRSRYYVFAEAGFYAVEGQSHKSAFH